MVFYFTFIIMIYGYYYFAPPFVLRGESPMLLV